MKGDWTHAWQPMVDAVGRDFGEGRTEVTWTIEGELGFPGKVMDVLMGMDAMLGADFERGLAKLERLLAAQ